MDAKRFDALTRAVSAQTDRRDALKRVAGAALGLGGLTALGLRDEAQAKRCDRNKDCNGKDKCDKGKCVECKKNKDCKKDEKCTNKGKCRKK